MSALFTGQWEAVPSPEPCLQIRVISGHKTALFGHPRTPPYRNPSLLPRSSALLLQRAARTTPACPQPRLLLTPGPRLSSARDSQHRAGAAGLGCPPPRGGTATWGGFRPPSEQETPSFHLYSYRIDNDSWGVRLQPRQFC